MSEPASEPASDMTAQKSQEKQQPSSDNSIPSPITLNSRAKHPSTTNLAASLASATFGRSEMGEEEDELSSKLGKSADMAENGSTSTSKEQSSSRETLGNNPLVGEDAPQLRKWVYQTSHGDLTLAENLEKSKWEASCCKGANKSGE